MLKKTFIAAGTLAVVVFAAQPQAEAKTSFHFDIGIGVPVHGGYAPAYWDHGYYAPHRYWSVRRVLRKLNRRGYHGFKKIRDRGGYVKVKAYRYGHFYKIRVSTYNGRIIRRKRIY